MRGPSIRIFVICTFFVVLASTGTPAGAVGNFEAVQRKLAELETSTGGRLGVFALDTGSGDRIAHRADERFPFCSTFKMMLAAAALKRSEADPELPGKILRFTRDELVYWSPVTEKRLEQGMTVFELCAATLQYSDNTAANVLMRELGGPEAVTAFARSIGDNVFSLNRWEPELNSALPGDDRDTTSPAAMAASLGRLTLGDALRPEYRKQLLVWLEGNTTGGAQIRAGVPEGWIVGDKTGSGSYGTTNDIAVIRPPSGAPLVLAVYFTHPDKDAPARQDVLARATRLVIEALR